MCSRRVLIQWAVLAIVCTIAILIFPAAQGSFTSVHGPATALRAWQLAATILAMIAMAGKTASVSHGFILDSVFCDVLKDRTISGTTSLYDASSILRC